MTDAPKTTPSRLAAYPDNRGPFAARMRRLANQRVVVLELVPGFTFGLLNQQQANTFASQIRQAVIKWFGWMRYEVDGLAPYVRCTADVKNRVVRIDFLPASRVAEQGLLAANPEMMLALAEMVDRSANAIEPVGI